MIKCDAIQDLLPLYNDNVASESSCALVDEHIKSCLVCRDILMKMQGGDDTFRLDVDTAEIGAFNKIKRKIVRRNILIACVSIMAAAAISFGVFGYQTPLPYNQNKINANLTKNGIIEIYYDGDYTGVTARYVLDEVYITFYGSLFSRLYFSGEKKLFNIGSNFINESSGIGDSIVDLNSVTEQEIQINRVYYVDSSKTYLSDRDFEQARKDAILIWERVND